MELGAIHDALGEERCPLPFVRDVVSNDRRLAAAITPAFDDFNLPLEDLHRDQIILNLADALAAADPSAPRRKVSARHWRAVGLAKDLIEANVEGGVTSAELEAATGLTRYDVARHFRACLGTSPYRYLIMRRLDLARSLIRQGMPLVEAALSSGFADQSHMTRQFKKVYGISPGRWAAITVREIVVRDGVGPEGR